jgi:hypothetical protein
MLPDPERPNVVGDQGCAEYSMRAPPLAPRVSGPPSTTRRKYCHTHVVLPRSFLRSHDAQMIRDPLFVTPAVGAARRSAGTTKAVCGGHSGSSGAVSSPLGDKKRSLPSSAWRSEPVPSSSTARAAANAIATSSTMESKMLGGASQTVSKIRVKCNGT